MCVFFETDSVSIVSIISRVPRKHLTLPGRYVSSSELVPGDVYEVSDPNLTQFPSDGLLLSGDCIVNESMLTGKYFREFFS